MSEFENSPHPKDKEQFLETTSSHLNNGPKPASMSPPSFELTAGSAEKQEEKASDSDFESLLDAMMDIWGDEGEGTEWVQALDAALAEVLGEDIGGPTEIPVQKKKEGALIQRTKEKPVNKKKVVKKPNALRKSMKHRLEKAFFRNKNRKALPSSSQFKKMRAIFHRQSRLNYGFPSRVLNEEMKGQDGSNSVVSYDSKQNPRYRRDYDQIHLGGGSGGYFRRGWGGQPFLYLDSDAYDDSMIKSNYDEIIANFKGNDASEARRMLRIIENDEEPGKDIKGQARSLIVLLTQFIEAHNSRIPGSDKLARALLRRIALGQLTFKTAFNRRNGLFVSAWNKSKGKAKAGGQVAGRALFGKNALKNDKYSYEDLEADLGNELVDELATTVNDYYSDSSDDEDEGYESKPVNFSVKRINNALAELDLKAIKGSGDLPALVERFREVKKAYRKLALVHHPDRGSGGSPARFGRINEAIKFLRTLTSKYKEKGGVGAMEELLAQNLNDIGRRVVRVAGDGNCFYNTVLNQLGGGVNAVGLRGRIAQLIINNATHFQMFVAGADLNALVYDILTDFEWNNQGGDFAPQLVATVLGRRVTIVSPTGTIHINPIIGLNLTGIVIGPVGAPLVLAYNGVDHYDGTQQIMLE